MDAGLLQRLQEPALFDHPVSGFEVIETHISWILLTGRYAYKIKKPLDLGFIDGVTLEQRRHLCHEEIRLNQRLAPTLYLDVQALQEQHEGLRLVADTEDKRGDLENNLEYLVRMRQFNQGGLLNHLQERGALAPHHIDSLAEQVAEFHLHTDQANLETRHGTRTEIAHWALENFNQTESLTEETAVLESLRFLRQWTARELDRLQPLIEQRRCGGFVRDCHGDLHLGNVAVIEETVTVFDCIEFNAGLRVIDVISEIAFIFMDLLSRDETALAWRLLDRYLAITGDYPGLELLRFYAVYRAMVRTKVAMIRGSQPDISKQDMQHARQDADIHLALATRLMHEQRPMLILTRGLSGSGKSRLAGKLVETCGLIRLRSDVERKRLHGLTATRRSDSSLDGGIYTRDASRLTYEYLVEKTSTLLSAGLAVIVDAAFLQSWQRNLFTSLAREVGVPLHILDLHADEVTLRRRIRRRQEKGRDPSEADLSVLEHQIATADALDERERAVTTVVDANDGQADHALETLPDHLGCRAC